MRTRTERHQKQVPMRHLATLSSQLLTLGLSRRSILAGTGISRQALQQADTYVTYAQFLMAIQNLLNLPVPEDFFLRRSDNFSIADYGILGYAMMSSATMGQAIQIAIKYHQTAGSAIKPVLVVKGNNVELRAINFLGLSNELLRAIVENIFSSFPALLNLLTGSVTTVEAVRFSFSDIGKPRDMYVDVFGCEPEFECSTNSFVIRASILDTPLLQADPNAARLLEKSCQEMLAQLSEPRNCSDKVQHMLLNSPRALSAEQVADQLGIGARTLRRRLAQESNSFQTLSDQVRRRLALDYLAETKLSNQEIGELLGFTEATNFRRAFLRWTGQTPKAYRVERNHTGIL